MPKLYSAEEKKMYLLNSVIFQIDILHYQHREASHLYIISVSDFLIFRFHPLFPLHLILIFVHIMERLLNGGIQRTSVNEVRLWLLFLLQRCLFYRLMRFVKGYCYYWNHKYAKPHLPTI